MLILLLFPIAALAAEQDCSQPFDPKPYVGKSSAALEGACLRLDASWSLNPGAADRFLVSQYEAPGLRRVFFLEHSPRRADGTYSGEGKIKDFVELEPMAGPRERAGTPSELSCWEKGQDLFPEDRGRLAFGHARINESREVRPLRFWRLDAGKAKLVEVDAEAVECDPRAFHRYYEATLPAKEKAKASRRLKEAGGRTSSLWERAELLR